MPEATNDTAESVIEAYWIPGCSSCLRMKEFVEKTGLPFESVNAAASPERLGRLAELGLNVPAVVLGDEGVPGIDLVGIAKLVGFSYDPPAILPPSVLEDKYDEVIGIAAELFDQIPVAGLDYQSPDRDRTMRQLAGHIGAIIRGFLAAYEIDVVRREDNLPPVELGDTGTKDDLVAFALESKRLFDDWWDRIGYDDAFDRVLESHDGSYTTLLELFERTVWHTTQHVRQIEYFLEDRLDVTPNVRLSDDLLAGLPLPERIHV